MNCRNALKKIAFIILTATAQTALAAMTTYDFTQTGDFLGRPSVTGTITIENGTFVNQAAADALNNAQYSINMISDVTPEVWNFIPTNSHWFFSNYGNSTITLKSDGTTLEITVVVTAENQYGSNSRSELKLIEGDTLYGGHALFRYIGEIFDFGFFDRNINILRQGNAIVNTGGSRDLFYSPNDFREEVPYNGPFPFTAQFTYRYPAVSNPIEEIDVSPIAQDFGNVLWGQTSTVIVTISNVGSGPLTISEISLLNPLGVFSINPTPSVLPTPSAPLIIGAGDNFMFQVIFSPKAIQQYTGTSIKIVNSDADESTVEIPLSGTGALADTPSEQVTAVVDYIQAAITANELTGIGSGNSANQKVQALINMIEAAGDLLEAGQTVEGCQQLADLYLKVDGATPPPDFVTGEAREGLANAIQGLRAHYGCQ